MHLQHYIASSGQHSTHQLPTLMIVAKVVSRKAPCLLMERKDSMSAKHTDTIPTNPMNNPIGIPAQQLAQ